MKKLFAFLLLIIVAAIVAIQACNKDNGKKANIAPVAVAGNDLIRDISGCALKATISLNGGSSYDPGGNTILRYFWKQLSGPVQAFTGLDSNQVTVLINNLAVGEYKFELEVLDPEGLSG